MKQPNRHLLKDVSTLSRPRFRSEQLVYFGHERVELILVEKPCALDNAAIATDQHVSGDARIAHLSLIHI